MYKGNILMSSIFYYNIASCITYSMFLSCRGNHRAFVFTTDQISRRQTDNKTWPLHIWKRPLLDVYFFKDLMYLSAVDNRFCYSPLLLQFLAAKRHFCENAIF